MQTLSEIKLLDLQKFTLEEYFKVIELALEKKNSVDTLTELMTEQPYTETKPYLTRRQLKPTDNRFDKIELVYSNRSRVSAIVWDINIYLSKLIEIFGEPIIHNEPYSDSTAFAFRSKNDNIEFINTRHPKWLTQTENKMIFEYTDEYKLRQVIVDPNFSFVQFNIRG